MKFITISSFLCLTFSFLFRIIISFDNDDKLSQFELEFKEEKEQTSLKTNNCILTVNQKMKTRCWSTNRMQNHYIRGNVNPIRPNIQERERNFERIHTHTFRR